MEKINTKLKNTQEIIKQYSILSKDSNEDEIVRFRDALDGLDDGRHSSYVRYSIGDILILVFLALLSDADDWEEIKVFADRKREWLEKLLVLSHGIPALCTIQSVISTIDSAKLSRMCLYFFIEKMNVYSELLRKNDPFKKTDIPIISIDGKTSRGSSQADTGYGEIKPLHTLNAVSSDYGFSIGEVFVPEKTNEITAVPELLNMLDVSNTIVTWDALNTQKNNVKMVIGQKGDYVVALKANHPNLSEEVKDYFLDEELWLNNPQVGYHKTTDKEHNALITREYILSREVDWIYDKKSWIGLNAIGCVRKTIKPHVGKESTEYRYYLSSVTDILLFARSVRQHWGVEIFHWQLDVTFKDDANKTREKKSAKNLQIMKKSALALLKMVQQMYKMSIKKIRYSLALDFEFEIERIFSALDVEKVCSELTK